MSATTTPKPPVAYAVFAGFSACLVGLGLSRFAYAPLLPALIDQGWFDGGQAAYLGAANLLGYLAGAVVARRIAARVPARPLLRAVMVLAALAFFACAAPLSFAWFFVWRLVSGITGGALMALAAPMVLSMVPAHARGRAGGMIFTGVGVGVVLSGTLVPPLLQIGLTETWLALGAISVLFVGLSWFGWPDHPPAPVLSPAHQPVAPVSRSMKGVFLLYALVAVGLVPHMVFLVDFIARGLEQGVAQGAHYWVMFGLGAAAGPLTVGLIADRIGFAWTLRLAVIVLIALVGLPLVDQGALALSVSALIVGGLVPGVVPLVLGRLHELAGNDAALIGKVWVFATTAFALGQAAGAYGLSFLFAANASYAQLFAIATGALVAALMTELLVVRR